MPALPCCQESAGQESISSRVAQDWEKQQLPWAGMPYSHLAEVHAGTLAQGRVSDQTEPMGAMFEGRYFRKGMHLQGTEKKPTSPNPSSPISQSLEYIGIILYSQEIL